LAPLCDSIEVSTIQQESNEIQKSVCKDSFNNAGEYKSHLILTGEFDYDYRLSRQAYTSYMNIRSLKDRVKITVKQSEEVHEQELNALESPGNSLKNEAQ